MSNSVRPHRWQPTRLPCPWDSPGKNTGVGCHFLLQCMKVKSESEVAQSCPTLSNPMDCSPPGSSVHGVFQVRVLEWVAIAFSIQKSKVSSFYSFIVSAFSPKYCYDQVKKFYQREIMIVGKAFMSISYLSHVNTLISIRHVKSVKWYKNRIFIF